MFCGAEVDAVWEIEWPSLQAGNSVTVPCGASYTGQYIHSPSLIMKKLHIVVDICSPGRKIWGLTPNNRIKCRRVLSYGCWCAGNS